MLICLSYCFLLQISDIVVGQEPNVTAREALLRWARRSTARYPGVRVTDFTCSWRDGLAFSALLHRNRPDLVDWRGARASQPRERLDRVFHVAEREYGVTRLLDPEGNPVPHKSLLSVFFFSLSLFFPFYFLAHLSRICRLSFLSILSRLVVDSKEKARVRWILLLDRLVIGRSNNLLSLSFRRFFFSTYKFINRNQL